MIPETLQHLKGCFPDLGGDLIGQRVRRAARQTIFLRGRKPMGWMKDETGLGKTPANYVPLTPLSFPSPPCSQGATNIR